MLEGCLSSPILQVSEIVEIVVMQVNSSLGRKEQKSQLHKFHTIFRSRDRSHNNKRSLTVCTGVKFSSWFDFNMHALQRN